MSRSVALAVAVAVLAFAAPAQAEIMNSTVSTPTDPHFVLVDFDQPAPTIDIAGTASGSGNVDIVCLRAGAVHVLLRDQPVSANGTFALTDVPLTGLPGAQWPYRPGLPCRLVALPAGITPIHTALFDGPRLAISSIVRSRRSTGGPNDGAVYEADVFATGLEFAARAETFGSTGLFNAFIADANSSDALQHGLYQTGAPADNIDGDTFGLKVDGLAAYAPARTTNIVGTYFGDNFGAQAVRASVTHFSATTGDLTLEEIDPLVRCPNAVYVPTPVSCSSFNSVPVTLVRTTEFSHDTRVVRVLDRWASTDGRPHRLDLMLRQGRCYGTAGCSTDVVHRLPGAAGYETPLPTTKTGPIEAQQPIYSRHATDDSLGGTAVIPGQAVDFARFDLPYAFVLAYTNLTVPDDGALSIAHTYVTTASAADIQQSVADVLAEPPAPTDPNTPTDPTTPPTGSTPTHGSAPATPSHVTPPAAPTLTRHGRVRLLHGFRVRTRDWVQCPAGGADCVVSVHGGRVRSAKTTVAAGATARVTVKLNRRGVRALARRGRVRLSVVVSARAGGGAPLSRVRRLLLRI